MYAVKAMSLLHKTPRPDFLTPADLLAILKEGGSKDNVTVHVHTFGVAREWEYARIIYENLIPKQYFQSYLESVHDDKYYYIYDFVVIYEDDHPMVVYNSPYDPIREGGR